MDSKYENCIFIGYKDGLKGYKLWNPVTRKVVYNRDVVFREVKDVIKHEAQPKDPEKIEFELKKEESNSTAEEESEDEEPQTPCRRKPISNKWVFKKKTNVEGKVEKYKARLVEKGYSQVSAIDFGGIFSPVAKVASIRLLLSIVSTFDFEVEHMDGKTTFLHGDLEEEIYMKQP
eukprot:PITA_34315